MYESNLILLDLNPNDPIRGHISDVSHAPLLCISIIAALPASIVLPGQNPPKAIAVGMLEESLNPLVLCTDAGKLPDDQRLVQIVVGSIVIKRSIRSPGPLIAVRVNLVKVNHTVRLPACSRKATVLVEVD